ncbi:MAG TPA: helix-turn-helix transcriptional regulator [Candidatus Paceibacterota bacterium]
MTTGMTHNQAFGVALREQRLLKNKTQDNLALDAGLDRTFISLLELGRRSPTLDTMVQLSSALQIPLSTLILRVEELLAKPND